MQTEKNPTTGRVIELFGTTLEFLTSPDEAHNDFCVLKGVILPGVSVPLHSHSDTEDFFILSGKAQALRSSAQGSEWIEGQAGDYFHVPADAPHAWRNNSSEPFVALVVTTKRMGQFFQETGRPVTDAPQPVTPEDLLRFATIAARYGYWNATAEENAAVGIQMSF